jgi:hypothetical protein
MAHSLSAHLVFSGENGALSRKYQLPERLCSFHLHGFLFLEVNHSAGSTRDSFGRFDSQKLPWIALEPFAKFCERLEIGHMSILNTRECGMGDAGFKRRGANAASPSFVREQGPEVLDR